MRGIWFVRLRQTQATLHCCQAQEYVACGSPTCLQQESTLQHTRVYNTLGAAAEYTQTARNATWYSMQMKLR